MKNIKTKILWHTRILKILLLLSILFSIFWLWILDLNAEYTIPNDWGNSIKDVSINYTTSWDIQTDINKIWYDILYKAKVVVQWLMIIFIVYIGVQMIWSMWNDEEKLSEAKRQIRYMLIAIIFINIPWTLYTALHPENYWTIDGTSSVWSFVNENYSSNIFLNKYYFQLVFEEKIILFFKVLLFAIAIVMIILAGIHILTARWREEKVNEAKTKIVYSILALIFVGIIEAWKYVAFTPDKVQEWMNLFWKLANLALFFAWPTAIFFLTIAWYYYITANWDEDKVKKAKSIVINTVLATLILLASYTFLLDLATL